MGEIKNRDAYYCNLKFLLLFLVVFGHWIEPWLGLSHWVLSCYRVIYVVHMPLFVFLSGAFLTSARQAGLQARRALLYYLAVQGVYMVVSTLSGQTLSLLTPYWHLWYLLSLCQWSLVCLCLDRFVHLPARPAWVKTGILLLAVGIGCAAGCLPQIGRRFSLSRTLVFLPYMLAGWLCPQKDIFRNRKLLGLASLAGFGALYFLCGSAIPTGFFYQAESYGALGLKQGIALRLLCYLMGTLLGIGLLALLPSRRLPVSRLGADTLGIYLCHAPLVRRFRALPLYSWAMPFTPRIIVLAAPAGALWIMWLLYRLFQWRGQLCAVRAGPLHKRKPIHDAPAD